MGVAGEIGEDRLRTGKGSLGVDEPVFLPQRCEMGGEGRPVVQAIEVVKERQPARRVSLGERPLSS